MRACDALSAGSADASAFVVPLPRNLRTSLSSCMCEGRRCNTRRPLMAGRLPSKSAPNAEPVTPSRSSPAAAAFPPPVTMASRSRSRSRSRLRARSRSRSQFRPLALPAADRAAAGKAALSAKAMAAAAPSPKRGAAGKSASAAWTAAPKRSRKPAGYWDDICNLRAELIGVLVAVLKVDNVRMPTKGELYDCGRIDLVKAIVRHGGFHEVGEKLQLSTQRAPRGYWTDESNLLDALRSLCAENGLSAMPTAQQLLKLGRGDLINAVRHNGGFGAVALLAGLDLVPKNCAAGAGASAAGCDDSPTAAASACPSELGDFAVLSREVLDFTKKNNMQGLLPSRREFVQAGRLDLYNAVRAHGGRKAVAQRLDLSLGNSRKPRGFWQDLNELERELRGFMTTCGKKKDRMPTFKQLRDAGRSDLVNAIQTHGGFAHVAFTFGFLPEKVKRPRGHWNEFDALRVEVLAYIREHGYPGLMPPQEQLRKRGRADLLYAIERHGGSSTVARRLHLFWHGPSSFWRSFPNVQRRLMAYVKMQPPPPRAGATARAMPNLQQLLESGRYDLIYGVAMHGGVVEVARRLRLPVRYKFHTEDYWLDVRCIEDELRAHLQLFPREERHIMPTSVMLVKAGRGDLADAVRRQGWLTMAQRMGLRITAEQRPSGFWACEDNARRELRCYVRDRQLPQLPTLDEVRRDGRADLAFALQRYHGGDDFLETLRRQLPEEEAGVSA